MFLFLQSKATEQIFLIEQTKVNSCQYESMLKEYAEYLEAARIKLMPKELNCSGKEDLHQQLLSHQVAALCLYLPISCYFDAKSCCFLCAKFQCLNF